MSSDVMDYSELSTVTFKAVWQTLLALAPGLNPDEIGYEGGGWEEHPVISSIGQEALRRYEEGDFLDDDFYDFEAQRSGLPNREEYPGYTIDENYYRDLDKEDLQVVRRTVEELPLDFNEETPSENPVVRALQTAIS